MQGEVSHIQIFTLHLFRLSIFTAMTISHNTITPEQPGRNLSLHTT